MTRLRTEWIEDIEATLKEYEKCLEGKTGFSYAALAREVSGFSIHDMERTIHEVKVAVIPITTGLGLITSFCESVAAIVRIMGFEAFVTDKTDVDGIFEAYTKGADIIYIADDDRFIAMNLHKNKIADNNYATALGYVTALQGMEGTLADKEVLLLGYGIVGQEILNCLNKKGAIITVYDKDMRKLNTLSKNDIKIIEDPNKIVNYRLIIDATSEGNWIHRDMLHPELQIVTPGVPLSLDKKAYEACSDRIIDDYLQIGVAVMLGLAL